jgi:hypothetical protein
MVYTELIFFVAVTAVVIVLVIALMADLEEPASSVNTDYQS